MPFAPTNGDSMINLRKSCINYQLSTINYKLLTLPPIPVAARELVRRVWS
jgi:hypothetical protein